MLLFSYIISAALEAAITWLEYQATGEIPGIYALLAGSSLLSIAIEFSAPGEAARQAFKEAGKNMEPYDIFSNLARTGIYFAVLFGLLAAEKGAMMACGCIFLAMILSMMKM